MAYYFNFWLAQMKVLQNWLVATQIFFGIFTPKPWGRKISNLTFIVFHSFQMGWRKTTN